MLLFVGDNGFFSNALQLLPADHLVALINQHGTKLALVILNGCKTSQAAHEILKQCPQVKFCICWSTRVHSEAAALFGKALAHNLAHIDFDEREAVNQAYWGAMEAVLKARQPGRLHAMPLGIPMYKFVDPDDERNVYQTCPCSNAHPCSPCPYASDGHHTPPAR